MLEFLEKISKYGLIDIFFGIGVPTFLWISIRLRLPKNYKHLNINVSNNILVTIPQNPSSLPSIAFAISNSGYSNFYIARAYFLPYYSNWQTFFLNKKTNIKIHLDSDKIADKNNAYELKFIKEEQNIFSEYETIIRPGFEHRKSTWLALIEPLPNEMISSRLCGTLYIEYATREFQGVHKIRV